MSHTITPQQTGVSVYGVPQVAYKMDGATGLDFGSVVAKVTLRQAAILDAQTSVVTSAVRLRQKQLEAIGNGLALIDSILARFKLKDAASSDKISLGKDECKQLLDAKKTLERFGYTLDIGHTEEQTIEHCCKSDEHIPESWDISRGVTMRAQSKIQELIDTEDNNLQQDMISVQGFMQKRDKAFDGATDIVKKYEGTGGNIIRTIV